MAKVDMLGRGEATVVESSVEVFVGLGNVFVATTLKVEINWKRPKGTLPKGTGGKEKV